MADYDFEAWPDVLQELAKIIGPESTLRLARECGGLERTYIPHEPTADHPWAKVLSAEHWSKVVEAFGGQRVDLPLGTFVRILKRDIMALAEQGVPHRQIAIRLRTTERHVRRVLQGLNIRREDPRQGKLFG